MHPVSLENYKNISNTIQLIQPDEIFFKNNLTKFNRVSLFNFTKNSLQKIKESPSLKLVKEGNFFYNSKYSIAYVIIEKK